MLCADNVCVQSGKPCSSCHPLKLKHCMNMPTSREASHTISSNEDEGCINKNCHDGSTVQTFGALSAHVSLSSDDSRYDNCNVMGSDVHSLCAAASASAVPNDCVSYASQPLQCSNVNNLLYNVYGASLIVW